MRALAAYALQHSFYQMFCFRAWDEDIRRDLKRQAKKLLLTDDVLDRFRTPGVGFGELLVAG